MRIWLLPDTHFNHRQIVDYCGRPENHTELIIRNWRQISPKDMTIHLGDVIFDRPSELGDILSKIPGRKVLVMGNHDKNKPGWYMNKGFDFACQALIYRDVFFTHKPADFLPPGCIANIHGHLHNTEHRDSPRMSWHIKLAVEESNYKPILLDKVLNDWKKTHADDPITSSDINCSISLGN